MNLCILNYISVWAIACLALLPWAMTLKAGIIPWIHYHWKESHLHPYTQYYENIITYKPGQHRKLFCLCMP